MGVESKSRRNFLKTSGVVAASLVLSPKEMLKTISDEFSPQNQHLEKCDPGVEERYENFKKAGLLKEDVTLEDFADRQFRCEPVPRGGAEITTAEGQSAVQSLPQEQSGETLQDNQGSLRENLSKARWYVLGCTGALATFTGVSALALRHADPRRKEERKREWRRNKHRLPVEEQLERNAQMGEDLSIARERATAYVGTLHTYVYEAEIVDERGNLVGTTTLETDQSPGLKRNKRKRQNALEDAHVKWDRKIARQSGGKRAIGRTKYRGTIQREFYAREDGGVDEEQHQVG